MSDEAMGQFLHNLLGGTGHPPGPPYVHTFAPRAGTRSRPHQGRESAVPAAGEAVPAVHVDGRNGTVSGDYAPIQHLLDETDGYHVVIGLKDRIKDQLRRAYAIGFFHGGDDEAAKPASASLPDDPAPERDVSTGTKPATLGPA